jgi:hypothetical protein
MSQVQLLAWGLTNLIVSEHYFQAKSAKYKLLKAAINK